MLLLHSNIPDYSGPTGHFRYFPFQFVFYRVFLGPDPFIIFQKLSLAVPLG